MIIIKEFQLKIILIFLTFKWGKWLIDYLTEKTCRIFRNHNVLAYK